MNRLELVLDRPRPSLDENSVREQLGSYQTALKLFSDPNTVNVFTVPAGAGSGKTRTLVATIIGLLRLGIDPNLIDSISFTNASADDLQEKLIKDLAALSQSGTDTIKVSNLGFSTIHKHAIDFLKKLEPHVGGVAYYFEDGSTSTAVAPAESPDDEAMEKATRLALYSSIVHSPPDIDLYEALKPIIDSDQTDRFVLANIKTENHVELAKNFIKKEMMSDAGLGAFTNIDDTDPNFSIAVAIDALLRLYLETTHVPIDEKRQRFGIPAYMMVDEAQDLDVIQLLYLRALAINGVSIMMVGDPRQTLFEFRKSVSEWPFLKAFLEALFQGTSIQVHISNSPLKTNYRCRKEILGLAEDISERMASVSKNHVSDKIERIIDPPESVVRSHHHETGDKILDADKEAPAVRFFLGDKTSDFDFLMPKGRVKSSDRTTGSLSRFARRLEQMEDESISPEKEKALKSKINYLQIPSLCGGGSQHKIESAIQDLYERAKAGDSVAILTRNGLKSADIRYIQKVLRKKYPDIENPSSLRINQINSEKNASLSTYWFFGADEDAHNEVPFSSIMIAAAMHYHLSWDRNASDELKLQGLREFSSVIPASSPEDAKRANEKGDPESSIRIELRPFVSALMANANDFFPMMGEAELRQYESELVALLARFVKEVLFRYSVVLWERFEGRIYTPQPCRFQSCCTVWNKSRGIPMLRPLPETKNYFRLFWEALASTPFQLSESDRALLARLGVNSEWMTPSTTMINFPEELAVFNDRISVTGSKLKSHVVSRFDDFIRCREAIHEQFSKIYHHKTRVYLREVARQIGKMIRLDTSVDPDFVMIAAYDHFRGARQKARVNTWVKDGRNNETYMGLFADMQAGMRDIQIKSKPKRAPNLAQEGQVPILNFTTIHSSKGLEWDHVLIFFPPGTSDTQSSFKSVRDLLYVAFTRAARTLTVVIPTDKNYKKDSASNSPMVVARHIVSEYAREHDFFDRKIELNDLSPLKQLEQDEKQELPVKVELQTTHSELEKALSCRMHHHIQHNRNLSSMVPLTPPSYSFFFHTALSSICAGLIGQRLPIPDDPVADIVRVIDSVSNQENLDEERVYTALMTHAEAQLNDLMSSMIPMYYLSSGKRYMEAISYYARNFASQLASITVGSQLFQNILLVSRIPGHKIWIEKPIKDCVEIEEDNLFLPILGIPDIKISGSKINFVCDYKTIPYPKDPSGQYSESELLMISEKTSTQINLYQGLGRESQDQDICAEIIYVPDITLFESEEIPVEAPSLPEFNNTAQYKARNNLKNAVVLSTNRFDANRFDVTSDNIAELRFKVKENLEHVPRELFSASPLIGENSTVEVTYDSCRACASAVHCQKRKKFDSVGALV